MLLKSFFFSFNCNATVVPGVQNRNILEIGAARIASFASSNKNFFLLFLY